jgi:hypothetical protein
MTDSYTPVKIIDIADELHRELGEPDDISIPSIAFWLRTNLGKLNIHLNKKYFINTLDLEVDAISPETFTITEKTIFKKLYNIHYYDRQIIKLIGKSNNLNLINQDTSSSGENATTGSANSDSLEISENGFSYKKTNSESTSQIYKRATDAIKANTQFVRQLGLNFVELKKAEVEELNHLTNDYNSNEVRPMQVAGDDTIPAADRPYSYNSFIRNIENL